MHGTIEGIPGFVQGAGCPARSRQNRRCLLCFDLLGVELDTVAAFSRLPADNLLWLGEVLEVSLAAKKLTLKEQQVLVGHLNFA